MLRQAVALVSRAQKQRHRDGQHGGGNSDGSSTNAAPPPLTPYTQQPNRQQQQQQSPSPPPRAPRNAQQPRAEVLVSRRATFRRHGLPLRASALAFCTQRSPPSSVREQLSAQFSDKLAFIFFSSTGGVGVSWSDAQL